MPQAARNRPKPPVPKRLSIRDWQKGYISTQASNRTPLQGLRSALNVILSQDGTIRPRPSRVLYGVQPLGTMIGPPVEFTKRVGSTSENYLISMQVVGGVAQIYVQKDGGVWTLCTGKTYDTSARVRFCPIRDIDKNGNDEDKVIIFNGVDYFSYLDINTLLVVTFTPLAATTPPTLTVGAGLTGSIFNNRYRITAGNRGETAASVATLATTLKLRGQWTAANEYIDVAVNRVVGAERYHFYYGNIEGKEEYLFSIDDPSPHDGTGTLTWRDTGFISPDIYRTAPDGDTTVGPVGGDGAFINGQLFIVRDPIKPKYVRYGGTGKSVLDFSPYGGGGFQPVGGNKEVPVKAVSFRDNGGNPAITILCRAGKRYTLVPQSQTIGNTILNYYGAREENGADGTDAPDTVALIRDQLIYMSRDGAKSTFTKPQVQTILSTEGLTDLIQPDISRLNSLSLDKACGLVYENRWYIALPVGSSNNNEIWILDFNDLRKGAWMRPWEIAADWMWLYNDNPGLTHFCTLDGNQIYEFTYSVATQDNGVPFSTGISTGILSFSEDGQEWAKVIGVTYILQNPVGFINAAVTGKTEDLPIAPLGSGQFASTTDVAGWGESGWGVLGWSQIGNVPNTFGVERTEIYVEVDEVLNWLSCALSSSAAGVDFQLTDIVVEYFPVGTKKP